MNHWTRAVGLINAQNEWRMRPPVSFDYITIVTSTQHKVFPLSTYFLNLDAKVSIYNNSLTFFFNEKNNLALKTATVAIMGANHHNQKYIT